jgi:ATP-dependent DNA helicase PIF1
LQEHSPGLERCTNEQRRAIEAALRGDSIFITGPGGTGKSFLLSVLYDEFRLQGKRMAVTAMTGCAALLLGSHAKTLHSWAGIGLGKGPADTHIRSIVMNGRKKKNWNQTDCLVIDEVSMLTPQLLELLDQIARIVRKRRDAPIGGLQLIFVGDFYQLPPVSSTQFAFQSSVWKDIVKDVYELTIIHRQKDPVFQKILNQARIGELSPESVAILTERKTMSWKGQAIRPTMLFTRNADVNEINSNHLAKLKSEEVVFQAKTVMPTVAKAGTLEGFVGKGASPISKEEETIRVQKLDKDGPYETHLVLKVGAQVMLVANLSPETGLVNGSRGVVERFEGGLPYVKFLSTYGLIKVDYHKWESEGDVPLYREQIPLRLAYALTIHKAQGASLDSALVDIGRNTFEYGQAYVALSRVRSLEALYVYDIDPVAFRVNPAVRDFYNGLTITTGAE